MRLLVYFSMFATFLIPLQANPTQTSFAVKEQGSQYQYEFGWRDSQGRENNLVFSLHQRDVRQGFAEFQPIEAAHSAAQISTSQINFAPLEKKYGIKIRPTKGGYQIISAGRRSNMDAVHAEIAKLKQKAENDILKRRFYTAQDTASGKFVSIDFEAIIKRYQNIGRIIATAASANVPDDKREAAQYWLDFIQSIPYSTEFTNKAGFQTPIGLYTENKGDCDTKAVAYAGLLQQFGIRSILIDIPGHIFMGVDFPSTTGDITATYKGRQYVLCEPAGKGFKLGEVSNESLQGINVERRILGPF